jgi:uncharacterized NAD(P)/FAD-binding protein YdhS
MKAIAIIGFGFCGRLAFFHLAKNSPKKTKIIIFEKDGPEALGPAFSGFSPHYILNVPAIKMSAFSDDKKNFCEFLKKNYAEIWQETGEGGFAPRQIYGQYLREITDKAFAEADKNGIEVVFVKAEVSEIFTQKDEQFLIKTKNNKRFEASQILLATSFKQSDLPYNFDSKNVIRKLWDKNSQTFHSKKFYDKKICLIGSGLTAVDVITGLKKNNFRGKIFVISRHGNFPKKHFSESQKIPNFISAKDAKKGVLFLCLKIRNFLKENQQFDLRHVVDSIRSITVLLWQNFDEKNKKLFRRLIPYWNIFRHRAPSTSIEMIEKMIAENQVEIRKKGMKKIAEKNGKILLQNGDEKIECDYLLNCLGFEFRAKKYPLLAQMIEANLLQPDFFLVKSNHAKIHLLGGLNIGRDFECTAVPDLRASVEAVVASIGGGEGMCYGNNTLIGIASL